jgi:hypothetical protein
MTDTLSRRRTLGLGVAAVAGGIGAAAAGAWPAAHASDSGEVGPQTHCVDPSTLTRHTAIGGATLIYELTGDARTDLFNEAFFQRLYNWRMFYYNNNPWSLLTSVWNLGAYANRPGSWHCDGRAFDITRGYGTNTGNTLQFLARYDIWSTYTGSTLVLYRRRYWAAAASLHYYFRDTLTYWFDAAHRNHIHVDNGQSGTSLSTFSTGSGTQVQSVQAMLSYVWGYSERNTTWDDSIDGNRAAAVLARIGYGGRITSGQNYWLAFLQGTVRKGTGLQAY